MPTVQPELSGDFGTLMTWVDHFRRLKVRTNADTPHDAKVARQFGAEGIGLCRTEHMFFEGERIMAVREMILAADLEGRKHALAKILPMQKGDFLGIFRAMNGLPVTIRLLDPPLHEFLPHTDKEIEELAEVMKVSPATLKNKVEFLHEFNPMLGHRGCRLGITFPEIYDMQVRAIIEAACELVKNEGFKIVPEIMIPLVAEVKELAILRANAIRVADEVIAKYGVKVEYLVGTMIELPRAALTADKIAEEAEFFSFGTNDLTQTTFGLCRDDAGKFLPYYVEREIFPVDPFVAIDQDGVGQLVKMGCEKGRAHPARDQARHLRRARRRALERQLLPPGRPRLRLLLPLPGAHRPAGGGARGAQGAIAGPVQTAPAYNHQAPREIPGGFHFCRRHQALAGSDDCSVLAGGIFSLSFTGN